MTYTRHKPEYRIANLTEQFGYYSWEMRFPDGTRRRFYTGEHGRGLWTDTGPHTTPTERLAEDTDFNLSDCTRQTRIHRIRRFWARLRIDPQIPLVAKAEGEVEFKPLAVWCYLAELVQDWRNRHSDATSDEERLVSSCYIDAYQSVLFNLYGRFMPPEEV